MKYERIEDLLIEFDEYGFAPTITAPYEEYKAEEQAIKWKAMLVEEIRALISKVREYENKIGNGTLVDTSWQIVDGLTINGEQKYDIIATFCEEELIYANLTKAEAEARLKELQK